MATRSKIGRSILVFAATVATGVLLALGASLYAVKELRVGGPLYTQIVLGKDLIADVLPPPAYIIESHLEATLALQDPSTVDLRAKRLSQLHQDFEARQAYWLAADIPASLKGLITEESHAQVERFYAEAEGVFIPALRRGDAAVAQASYATLSRVYADHRAVVDQVVVQANAWNREVEARAAKARQVMITTALTAAVAALAALIGGAIRITANVVTPVVGMTSVMSRLSDGEVEVAIPSLQRHDEVGAMARAVQVFKENAVARAKAETDAAHGQRALESERRERDARREETRRQQEQVVGALAAGLARLTKGDLIFRLNEPFAAEYEPLRKDFNEAMNRLQQTLRVVADNTQGINTAAGQVSQAADDLSRRTEQQAASLEETASALDQITATVRKAADGAGATDVAVRQAGQEAGQGRAVVREAVAAMSKIEQSASQVSQIIGVIDEIAFQTNLLALNAGVEAARAGDAGKGFAVVASEVRALAQRSAAAAKEIKALISASSDQVAQGVALVGQTDGALERIVVQVGQIGQRVAEIALSVQEQSTGLHQVNIAVNQMDEVTQQNAAMVEESTAASHALAHECSELTRLIGEFRLSDERGSLDRAA